MPVDDVQDLVMDTDEEDSLHTDSNDIITVYDGVHSDLFEDLFQNLPTDAQYRSPGLNPSGCFGPLLLLDYMLITQNGVLRHHLWCLSTPPLCGIPTFTVGTCSRNVKIKIKKHTHYFFAKFFQAFPKKGPGFCHFLQKSKSKSSSK